MHFLADYGIFLAKTITVLAAILAIIAAIATAGSKSKEKNKGTLRITKINDQFKDMAKALKEATLSKDEFKKAIKAETSAQKAEKKQKTQKTRKRIFVLNFDGDIKASAVKHFREEVTAILTIAKPEDEVVVRLESAGGMVHSYGLAASQLQRIRAKNIPLTICIDKIAASGGYLMACVGDQILAAPFAIIGSIGVIAQLPNFHRLLKKNDIEFEQITAGEYKRTLTLFGENTKKGREKFQEEVDQVHVLFKQFISNHRPTVEIDKVATGEYWQAIKAKDLNLVDRLETSDDYLLNASKKSDLFEVCFTIKKSLGEKVGLTMQTAVDKTITNLKQQNTDQSYV